LAITKKKHDRAPLFVEVYWDGFEGNIVSGAWGKAQASGPLVGFQMRQLFKAIQQSYKANMHSLPKLMFITHSSGAFVAASTLGNPCSTLPDLQRPPSPEWVEFSENKMGKSEKYPIPEFPEIRLGMMAAATASNTFTGGTGSEKLDCDEKGKTGGILSENTTLIFTINGKDSALTKYLGLANFDLFGATGAGAEKDLYCNELKQVKGRDTKAYDFSDGGVLLWNSHKAESYLDRANTTIFLEAVLGYQDNYQFNCPNRKWSL
jgi:hypothetical protein